MTSPVPVSSLRALLHIDDEFRQIASIRWSNSDASVYVFPALPSGGYAYGGLTKFPGPDDPPSTFDYSRQLAGVTVPKLSIHESGRCHAEVDGETTAPLFGPSLFDLAGGHVATISCFSSEGLPVVKPRGGKKMDLVLRSAKPQTWTSTHLSLHVSRTEPGPDEMHAYITVRRVGRPGPLYIGLYGRVGDSEQEEKRGRGVLAIAGWGPGPQERTSTAVYAVTSASPPGGGPAGTLRRNPTFDPTG